MDTITDGVNGIRAADRMSYGKMEEIKRIIRQVIVEINDELPQPKQGMRVAEIQPPTEKEQRVMDSMMWLMDTTGKEAFMPNIVAYFSRFQQDAPAFIEVKKSLRRQKYIELVYGGHMRLTEAGKSMSRPQHGLKHDSPLPKKRTTEAKDTV